jgi:transcription termination factor Rho
MTVFERTELQASSLSDLHAIAGQVGLEGFRRMRKADLIAAILEHTGAETTDASAETQDAGAEDADGQAPQESAPRPRRRRASRSRRAREEVTAGEQADERPARASQRTEAQAEPEPARIAAGVVEVLGNGSAFLRVDPPEPSDDDVYISAAQVRRCELVSGDRVTGPVRTPRRSERYPSLVRVDTINGASADAVSEGARYEDLPIEWPGERLELGSQDPTVEAIEWMIPIGKGSRAVIVGPRASGKSETLRRLLEALQDRDGLELSLVLVGTRPEEIAQWQAGPLAPAAALDFAAGADLQDQAVERAIDTAKRLAARGGDVLVAIDSLDGLHPHVARKALAAARNLRESGSLTVIALAERPLGGETTVITLDPTLASTGRQPILDLTHSGTVRAELLVGEDGAAAITKTRLAAVEAG